MRTWTTSLAVAATVLGIQALAGCGVLEPGAPGSTRPSASVSRPSVLPQPTSQSPVPTQSTEPSAEPSSGESTSQPAPTAEPTSAEPTATPPASATATPTPSATEDPGGSTTPTASPAPPESPSGSPSESPSESPSAQPSASESPSAPAGSASASESSEPPVAQSPPASGSSSDAGLSGWPAFLGLAALLTLAGLAAWLLVRRSARQQFDRRLEVERAQVQWVLGQLVPAVLDPALPPQAAAAQLVAASPTLDQLEAELGSLTSDAPDSGRTQLVLRMAAAVAGLRAAVGTYVAQRAAAAPDSAAVEASRAAVQAARDELAASIALPA